MESYLVKVLDHPKSERVFVEGRHSLAFETYVDEQLVTWHGGQ
jgi:hypothetical protein